MKLPVRFWVETALATASTAGLAVTLVNPQWIEDIFGVDPDGGDGSTEWGWVLTMFVVTAVCIFAARRTWKRSASAA